MRVPLASNSISARLTRMNLLVTLTALLLASIAFFTYDLISYQKSLVRSLAAEARIAGLNSVSALVFNDRESAQTTLAALASSPDIQGAALTTGDGKIFAEYRRKDARGFPLPPLAKGANQQSWITGRHVVLADRILFQGNPQGIVYISAELGELGGRARRYLATAAIVLLFCLLAAMLITVTVRRVIAGPIVSLAAMSRAISRDRDYSLRAPASRDNDEISVLIDSFNEMLAEIEQRDSALRQARDELELRVQERTVELKAANRELEAFSYTVAHDLRGPLDAIGGIGYILERGYAGRMDAEGREMLDRLRGSSAKMAVLIDDLLNLSRAGTSSLETSTVDLSALAAGIARDLETAEPGRKVEFSIAPGATAHADPGLIRVVLENLLRNAWKYTATRDTALIEFGFRRIGAEIVCFVQDNGAGFNPELAERLFQPFQRLHTQAEFSGTGIGLATVKRIIVRHGGKVWAESVVDRGATFYFALNA